MGPPSDRIRPDATGEVASCAERKEGEDAGGPKGAGVEIVGVAQAMAGAGAMFWLSRNRFVGS